MSYLRKIQYHVLVAVLLAALLFQNPEMLNRNSKVLAWWGTIYPQFCFMEAPEEGNMPQKEPKFHFWITEKIAIPLFSALHHSGFGVKMGKQDGRNDLRIVTVVNRNQ